MWNAGYLAKSIGVLVCARVFLCRERPEEVNGNRREWRELMMFRRSSPLFYQQGDDFEFYDVPPLDTLTYRARTRQRRIVSETKTCVSPRNLL